MNSILSREAVVTILWLSLGIRLGICYAVSLAAKIDDCYGREHWNAVTKIFRYLDGTMKLDINIMAMNNSSNYIQRFNFLTYLLDFKVAVYNYDRSIYMTSIYQQSLSIQIMGETMTQDDQ